MEYLHNEFDIPESRKEGCFRYLLDARKDAMPSQKVVRVFQMIAVVQICLILLRQNESDQTKEGDDGAVL
jgi:hypothetical protein